MPLYAPSLRTVKSKTGEWNILTGQQQNCASNVARSATCPAVKDCDIRTNQPALGIPKRQALFHKISFVILSGGSGHVVEDPEFPCSLA